MEAVKELGLEKVAIGCLPSVPLKIDSVFGKTYAAKKIITVDGCPFECGRKTVETAGINITRSIMLARDIGMKKVAFHTDIGKGQGMAAYISEDEVRKAKELIINAILQD